MDMSYQLALIFAGLMYIVTPGPVFLRIVSLVSSQGRQAGFRFISGAIFGVMMWFTLTCASLISADKLPKLLFAALTVACATYLFFLATKLFRSTSPQKAKPIEKPFREGLFLSILNPKAYPVMTSVFSVVFISYPSLMNWSSFGIAFFFALIGFLSGYIFMVLISSYRPITTFYTRHIRWTTNIFGCIFCLFGLSLLFSLPHYF